jgi:hypothetical protein
MGPIGPRGEREEAGCPGGHGLQQGRPGHAVERVPEVQLKGHIPGAARQARPQGVAHALAAPRDADPELQGGEGRTSVLAGGHCAEARQANPHLADGDRAHAAAKAYYIVTERDGRKGPPAGNKARCNRTNTPHSKAYYTIPMVSVMDPEARSGVGVSFG